MRRVDRDAWNVTGGFFSVILYLEVLAVPLTIFGWNHPAHRLVIAGFALKGLCAWTMKLVLYSHIRAMVAYYRYGDGQRPLGREDEAAIRHRILWTIFLVVLVDLLVSAIAVALVRIGPLPWLVASTIAAFGVLSFYRWLSYRLVRRMLPPRSGRSRKPRRA